MSRLADDRDRGPGSYGLPPVGTARPAPIPIGERCAAGPACPNFAGYLPLGDHGWYHRRRAGCPDLRLAPITLVGVLSNHSHRLHAAPLLGGRREGRGTLCQLVDPSSTPERRRWDPDHPRACSKCVRRAMESPWNGMLDDE